MAREFTVVKACHLPNEFGKVAHHSIGTVLRGAFYSRFVGSGMLRENAVVPVVEPPQKPTTIEVTASQADDNKENVTPKKEEPKSVAAPAPAKAVEKVEVLTPTPVTEKSESVVVSDSLSLAAVERMSKKELKQMCKELGLSDEGSTSEIRKRLKDEITSK
jgi:hypothetical protein